jgi:hypothetical protein
MRLMINFKRQVVIIVPTANDPTRRSRAFSGAFGACSLSAGQTNFAGQRIIELYKLPRFYKDQRKKADTDI